MKLIGHFHTFTLYKNEVIKFKSEAVFDSKYVCHTKGYELDKILGVTKY